MEFSKARAAAETEISRINKQLREIASQKDKVAKGDLSGKEKVKKMQGLSAEYDRLMGERGRLIGPAQTEPAVGYLSLTGEVEARLTQRRMDMTAKQRKAEPPWETMEKMLREEGLLAEGQAAEDVLITKHDTGGMFARASDAAYLAAVDAGNMEAAQRMVDAAAERAGYWHKQFHQTNEAARNAIYKEGFRLDKGQARLSDEQMPDAFFFKSDPADIGVGDADAPVQMEVFLNHRSPKIFNDRQAMEEWLRQNKKYAEISDRLKKYDKEMGSTFDKQWKEMEAAEKKPGQRARVEAIDGELDVLLEEWKEGVESIATEARRVVTQTLRDAGFDSIHVLRDEGSFGRVASTVAVFDSEQIKAADTVTYDDSGNVIPLSQRFDASTPDIRYARPSDLPANLKPSDYGAPVERVKHSGAQIRRAIYGGDEYVPETVNTAYKNFLRTGDLPVNLTFGKHEQQMRILQRSLMLPQWIAKYHPETFGKLYHRTKKRIETRNDMNTEDILALDSFWKLKGEQLEAVRDVIWAIDGQKLKGVPDSIAIDEKTGMQVNEDAYTALQNWIVSNLNVSQDVAAEVIKVRRVLDKKWVQIDRLLDRSNEVDKNLIDQFRKEAKHKKHYFPHVRHGSHYLQIRDAQGKVVYRSHFDTGMSLTQQRAAKRELQKIINKHPEYKGMDVHVARNEKLPEESIYDTPIPTDAIAQILKTASQKAGPDMAHLFEQIMPEVVSDVMKARGFGAHTIHRTAIPGHETRDIQKVLYQYITGNSGWQTKMEASRDYSKVLATMDAKKDPELYKACKNYVSDMLRNSDQHDRRIAKAKSFFFVKYLGASIKTPVLNLTQVIVAGTSRLGMETGKANLRYFNTTGKMLVDVLSGRKTLPQEHRSFLNEFYDKGISGAQFTEEVSQQLQNDPVASGWDRFVKLLGIPMAMSERFNRTTVALTAFRVARDGKITNAETLKKYGRKRGEKFSYDEAMEFAKPINTDTNFDFGRHNRPELVRSEHAPAIRYVAGTGYTFRFFVHNLLSLWKWQYKQGGTGQRALMKSLAAVVAFGGLTSFPLYKTFMTAMRQSTGEDWEEKTIDRLLPDSDDTDWVRDLALYGLPTLGGTTLGSSMSIEMPMLSRYRVDQTPTRQGTRLFAEMLGIPFALMVDFERSVTAAYNRDPLRALETILPPVAANPLRARRAYSEGLYTHTGRPIVLPGETEPRTVTKSEAIGQAFGFQPVKGQKSWEMTQKIGDLQAYKNRKQRSFANRMAKAVHEGDFAEVRRLSKDIQDWNTYQAERGRFEHMIDIKHALATRMQGRQPPDALMPYAMRLRDRAGM